MKIYTLSYYSDVINTVLGNYSSFARAKDVLLEEVEACHEVLDGINCVELHMNDYGRYPVKDKAEVHAYYEIECNTLDDEDEEEDEEYDDEYDDYDDDDEDDDEEYDDDEKDDDWDEDDDEEEDYEDGENDECEAGPREILSQLICRGLCGIGIIVGE